MIAEVAVYIIEAADELLFLGNRNEIQRNEIEKITAANLLAISLAK